jgi:hypothetical protein
MTTSVYVSVVVEKAGNKAAHASLAFVFVL